MNPAITTKRPETTSRQVPKIEITNSPEVSSEIPRTREDPRRISLPRSSKPEKEERKKSDPVKKHKQLSKQTPKKSSSKKQQKPDRNEVEELGLKSTESVGCLRVCSTLILEVYQLLGGSLCDCQ